MTQWCQTIGRDPAEITRTVSIGRKDIPGNLEAFAEAGATYFILGLGEPWDFDLVAELIRWRDE